MFLFFGQPLYQKIMGGIFLLFAIILFKYQYGVEISKDKRIREYHSFYSYILGNWKFLPPIKHILILKVKQYKWDMRFGALGLLQNSSNNRIFQLILVYQNNRKQKLISTNIDRAEKFADELASLLKIEIKKVV